MSFVPNDPRRDAVWQTLSHLAADAREALWAPMPVMFYVYPVSCAPTGMQIIQGQRWSQAARWFCEREDPGSAGITWRECADYLGLTPECGRKQVIKSRAARKEWAAILTNTYGEHRDANRLIRDYGLIMRDNGIVVPLPEYHAPEGDMFAGEELGEAPKRFVRYAVIVEGQSPKIVKRRTARVAEITRPAVAQLACDHLGEVAV